MGRIRDWLRRVRSSALDPGEHIWYDYRTDTASPSCPPGWLAAVRATNPRLSENPIILFYWRVKNDAGWQGGFNKLYLTPSGLPVGWD